MTLTNYPDLRWHCFACLLLLLSIPAFAAELRGVVVRVVDGDTIAVQSGEEIHRVRLSGIDAPELAQSFGKEARASLAGLVQGKAVVIVWSKKDGYGRLLGTVLVGSSNVNLELIRSGAAWYFKRYASDVPEIERLQYEAAEIEARQAKRGLWQQQQAMPPWEWRLKRSKKTRP